MEIEGETIKGLDSSNGRDKTVAVATAAARNEPGSNRINKMTATE